MAYKAKFLHFKTKQSYNTERNKTLEGTDERKVFDAYISFIDEGPTICTWGKEYKCELSKDDIESLIDSKGFITIEDLPDNIDASKITSGTLNAARLPEIPIEKLPAGALERLVIVENQAARYQLTTSDVQEGDTVKQNDTGVMYFVVDTDNLANENGYKVYTAGAATSVPWSGVTGKPSTLEDYGVSATDPYLAKPTTFNWTGGTTAGPTGKLTGTNTNVSFPAIPTASKTASGVITTENQEFSGEKTFDAIVTSNYGFRSDNFDSITEGGNVYIGYNTRGGGIIYIGPDGDFNFGTSGGEYTGNSATATKVKNKLTFTGAVTGEYDGSSALTVNIPEGGGEIPIALPNPYPIEFTGAVTTSYDGSSATTVNIPSTSMTYSSYTYSATSIGMNTSNGITPGYVYYPSSWTNTTSGAFTIYVKADAFNSNTPDAVVIVTGTRQVNFNFTSAYGRLIKQSNILTTGSSSNAYRVYAFSYLGGSGLSTRVAVNCSEYIQ